MSVRLRVMLQEEIRKLLLPLGIPQTVGELKTILQETFEIKQDFTVQFQDQDFDGQFFTLLETKDIKDKDTIKVVLIEPVITLTFEDSLTAKGVHQSVDSSFVESSEDSCSTASTINLSSPESASSLRSESWPAQFEIPTFSFDTELILQAANEAYSKDGTLLSNPAVKSNILDKLADSIFVYTAYPSQAQREQVAEALVAKHPCLRDPVSFNGLYSWHNSLKYKLGNYRAKVRHLGLPELNVNSRKKKWTEDSSSPCRNLKKAKKSEVNYLPPHPQGETDATLEKERVDLLYECKKRDNNKVINEKMAKTFSLRRSDVILNKPPVIDFKARWPALFEFSQIEEEFRRITLKPLQSTFLGKLDQYTPKLLSLYRRKGGAVGKKLDETLDMLNEDSNIESRREVVIRGLIVYLGENLGELIKDFKVFDDSDAAAVQEAITTFVLGIFVVSKAREDLPKLAGIAIEGAEILFGIPDVAHACTYLMGLLYALDLRYPNKLKYTFEVFQKIFLELEDANKKMSSKVHDLKVCLHA
ncbi:uncharacterized protein LOC125705809 [Brienomyrus brachyistius]|uniref:uncharacterized protein LOC125705809 n=2 Tax=Brienomyrus brachyistius TaxID=42636 RepID=UPI0020B45CFD|nr:uncharacterized protein LOC125705809 [Brienomyrus brachyistius]XP_048828043.1 uncharacterized protein LOC125705809 [Brienomyrus brachyistius]XP_048828044.1 uncharacterized protein LOC125705809 [Brienomyrus brachyistius]